MIRYEPSRVHKIDGTKRAGKWPAKDIVAREGHNIKNRQETKIQTYNQKKQTNMMRVGQTKQPRQQATQELQSFKKRNTAQAGRQEQGYKINMTQIELEVTYSVPGYKGSFTSAFTE